MKANDGTWVCSCVQQLVEVTRTFKTQKLAPTGIIPPVGQPTSRKRKPDASGVLNVGSTRAPPNYGRWLPVFCGRLCRDCCHACGGFPLWAVWRDHDDSHANATQVVSSSRRHYTL